MKFLTKLIPIFASFDIANIRSVTINPPTTLIVANIMAITDIIIARIPLAFETIMIAPTITMPDIAFEPDIKGVCKVEGTFVITSYPINNDKAKIIIKGNKSNFIP